MSQDQKIAERGAALLAARGARQLGLAPGLTGVETAVSEEFCEWLEFWAMTSDDPMQRILAADMRVKLATKNPEDLKALLNAEIKKRAGEMVTKVKAAPRSKVNYNAARLKDLVKGAAPIDLPPPKLEPRI
jgi:hypothetical protein